MKTIYSFNQFVINELNHQSPMPLGVNDPGFGQGAHVGNWGADYGNPSKGVRGHFGNKSDPQDPQLPNSTKNHEIPSVVYDPYSDDYIHEDDIQSLINDYKVKCRQNSEEPFMFDRINSDTILYIQKYLNN